jgi:DNA-binding transcriptional ArsR family regulator
MRAHARDVGGWRQRKFLDGYITEWLHSSTVFDVVAEPNRRRLLDALRTGERSVGELVDELGLSQPAVSKHLRVLREAGLVEVTASAQRRLYRLQPAPLREIDEWLTPYRTAWRARLDTLERHLDSMANAARGEDDGRRRSRRARSKR